MSKELKGNTGGIDNNCNLCSDGDANSDLPADGDATLPEFSGDAGGSDKICESHHSVNVDDAAEISKLSLNAKYFVGPRGAHCTASTTTAGCLRDGSSG